MNQGAALQQTLDVLSNFFEAGFAVVTWTDASGTHNAKIQFGNTYAQAGLANNVAEILELELAKDDDDEDAEV